MKKAEIVSFLKINKYFKFVWVSQVLSSVTINIINFMMMSKIYEKTGSSLAVSFLWIFYYIPSFFLGPFSGIFVDRWKKRSVLLYTNLLQSLIVLFFLYIGENLFAVYPFVFLYSLVDEFYIPAEASAIPLYVNKKSLPLANSLLFITRQGALILGFGLSGIMMKFFGDSNLIIFSSFLLFIAGINAWFLPKVEGSVKKINNFFSFWNELKTGYGFIASNKTVLFPMALSVFFGVILSSIGVSLPAVARQIFNIPIKDAGAYIIIPLGLGAICGSMFISKFLKTNRKKVIMKFGFKIISFVFIFLSVLLSFLGRLILPVGMLMAFLLGLGGLFLLIPNQTLLQENIPSDLRGRVFGTLWFATTVITLPSLLFFATIIDTVGIKPFLFLAGVIVLSVFFSLNKIEKIFVLEKNGNK